MDGLTLGPLFFSAQGLAVLLAILVAWLAARLLDRRRALALERSLTNMAAAGIVTGRLAWVALHPADYAAAPLTVFLIRDGGFLLEAACAAALLAGAWATRRTRAARIPLALAATAGIAVWSLAYLALEAELARTPVPRIVLRRLDGTTQDLAALKGRPLVVNLWATWCPPCRREMPALVDAQRRHPDVTFLLIDQGETQAAVETFLARQKLAGAAVLLDPAGLAGSGWHAKGLPTTLVYGRDGALLDRTVGGLSAAAIAERVEAARQAP